MKIVCDSCSTKYSIADEKVRGKVFKIKCKKCSHVIVVKGTEAGADGGGPAAPALEQKETSVFEYGKTEMNGSGGGDAVWYLVVDREQVGPLTVAEVEGRYKKGEIDSETYGWREGFSDWLRVAAIPEFGAFAGGGDTGQTPAPSADPSDLFGGGAKKDDGGGGDLFGGRAATTMPSQDTDVGVFAAAAAPAPARRTVAKEDLFGGGGGGGGSAGGELAGDVKPMTAQRNENSVLFSLKNLTDLASTGPSKAPSSGGSGGSGGHAPVKSAFTSGGGEGSSGLIDIRAMAATVGVGGAKPASSSSSDDDLPVFSAASFGAPSAGMLLPTVATQEKSNKVLFALIAVVGLLAVAAIVMVVVVLKSNKGEGEGGKDKMAAATPGGEEKTPGATPTPPTTPPGAMAGATPPTTPTDGMAAVGEKPKDDKEPVKEPERTTKPKGERTTKPRETKTVDREEEETPAPKPAATKKPACDEVACLVDSSLPCCKSGGSSSGSSGGSSGGGGGGGGSNLPEQLDRSAIQSGIASVRGRVQSCNDKFKQAGQVNVRFVVSPSGSVESASVSGKFAGSPTGSCVESAIESAKFKKAESKTVVNNYPFIFK